MAIDSGPRNFPGNNFSTALNRWFGARGPSNAGIGSNLESQNQLNTDRKTKAFRLAAIAGIPIPFPNLQTRYSELTKWWIWNPLRFNSMGLESWWSNFKSVLLTLIVWIDISGTSFPMSLWRNNDVIITSCAHWGGAECNPSLNWKCHHFDIFTIGCIGRCQIDNFRCSQWWKCRQINFPCSQWRKLRQNGISVSVQVDTVFMYWEWSTYVWACGSMGHGTNSSRYNRATRGKATRRHPVTFTVLPKL